MITYFQRRRYGFKLRGAFLAKARIKELITVPKFVLQNQIFIMSLKSSGANGNFSKLSGANAPLDQA